MAKGAAGAGSPARSGVYLKGLRELRRALTKVDKSLGKKVTAALRLVGRSEVKPKVQEEARRFRDSGTLERSVRYSATAKGASVYSNLEYAPVHEWGGTIRPRGVPIHIERREWMNEGVQRSRREIDASLEALLDWVADEWERGL